MSTNIVTQNQSARGRRSLPADMRKAAQFRVLLDPTTYAAFEKHVSDQGDNLSNFTRRLILRALASVQPRTV